MGWNRDEARLLRHFEGVEVVEKRLIRHGRGGWVQSSSNLIGRPLKIVRRASAPPFMATLLRASAPALPAHESVAESDALVGL